jgi:hypothetical protein
MLLNRIDISASNQLFAAGITVAPATNDPNRMDLYIVDRGVDNDANPNENDGKLYEMSVPLPPIGNLAPMVDVGRDKPTHVGEPVALNASVRDDGLSYFYDDGLVVHGERPRDGVVQRAERPSDIGRLQRQRDLRAPRDGKRHGPYRIR